MPTEIPYPLGNMINGGAHAGKNAPDIQEFLVLPVGAETSPKQCSPTCTCTKESENSYKPRINYSPVEREMKEDGHPTSPIRKPLKYKSKPVKQ